MLKTIGAQIKEFKTAAIITPLFMLLEVLMETIIPKLMANVIDDGIYAGDQGYIYRTCILMIICAFVSLVGGWMGAKYGAKASMGLGRNLRKAMFENIQTFSFSNIDKFSTETTC